jgi:hypothetical protein
MISAGQQFLDKKSINNQQLYVKDTGFNHKLGVSSSTLHFIIREFYSDVGRVERSWRLLNVSGRSMNKGKQSCQQNLKALILF